ncbi:hypothetical protein GCM10010121_069290 [Streptomyces brasiliensis]|uniref:Transposase IS4 N-terminal domain-containing protein n=1 Tax=Streptomyces brasiliensis TaxID=1954 RepID=A0A917L9H2_9ACTN|nr:hypothetical protein GCM10010121_069290 [Streptomyces brasiliensis]
MTVAAGRFAPGHLGELTAVVPFELVDAVLAETRTVERRLRDLPSRVGMYFLLVLCLVPEVGYRLVRDKLTAGLAGMPVASPSVKALRDLRRRLGVARVRSMFEVLAGPLARSAPPGVRFGAYRTVAFDGCSSLRVPDSLRNLAAVALAGPRPGLRHRADADGAAPRIRAAGPGHTTPPGPGRPRDRAITGVDATARGSSGGVFGPLGCG